MIEGIMAWVLLAVGFVKWEAEWFIASGTFAVAVQIYQSFHRGRRSDG